MDDGLGFGEYEAASCSGKKPIRSPNLAWTVADRITKRNRIKHVSYHCDFCGFWHVGTDMLRSRRRKRNG